jgi:hypothetical protein
MWSRTCVNRVALFERLLYCGAAFSRLTVLTLIA